MATTTIPWGDGSGDNIYLTYPLASGDQTVQVSSDANTGSARTKVVTFTSGVGNITQQLTVNQEAGEVPGSLISDYVQDGLFLHLDGKEKGSTTSWIDRIGNRSFAKQGGVTFNSDHVYFDGVDDYLRYYNGSWGSSCPARNAATIEIVYDNENLGTEASTVFIFPTNSKICCYINTSKEFVYTSDNSSGRAEYPPILTTAKASISVSKDRAFENGTALSLGSTKRMLNDITANYTYIGRSKSGHYFKGKIYSIRIYNRKLTQAEVMQNLSVDNLRFNLGLTLNQ